ncbi:MAG TPA: 3-phosphoshikimate 1-carboxyvinyltransferase [Nitrososphaeraceae archaeon]
MTSITIQRSRITGTIQCPGSKSYTHRAVAIASLANGKSTISNPLLARDTIATVCACKALGVDINCQNNVLIVHGRDRLKIPENVINAENSGTTIRLIAAISSLTTGGFTILTGDSSLRRRPMNPLIQGLNQLGVMCCSSKGDGTPPLVTKGGGMKGGTAKVRGDVSSQFLSSLLITGVRADSSTTIEITGRQVSRPYIDATISTMDRFGAQVAGSVETQISVDPGSYQGTTFNIPSDFSSAALVMAAGILTSDEITLEGLDFRYPQGDSKIIDIISRMGGRVKVDTFKGEAKIYGCESLVGGNFDLFDTPDLLPVVSILSLKASSPVYIEGIEHARLKETDRVANISQELTKLGASVREEPDRITINAPRDLRNANLDSHSDHRLFMAFTIASMLTEQSIVNGADSVDVSYPQFVSEMRRLGANIRPAP